jgi:hypothetical protein
MSRIAKVSLVSVLLFFGCNENEVIPPKEAVSNQEETAPVPAQTKAAARARYQTGTIYYVSTSGNDTGDGSSANPWKTLRYAVTRVASGQGHTINLSAGTFVESGLIEVPLGINIEGAGKDQTILKAASSFYYYPASPSYAADKFLISLNGYNQAVGNQILRDFTIDGDLKKLHGGVFVHYRSNVDIENVRVQNTNFTGIWLWDVKDATVANTDIFNCSWGSSGWCAGALNLGNLERVDIANVNINESTGYGIKAIGPSGYNNIFQLKIHDSNISVHPHGLWNGGSAPNIAIELWSVNLVGCEIYNTYVDNTISLVNSNAIPSTGVQTIRVHHNILDMETRADGSGYGVELTVHDAEIDHNYFRKGTYGIANWDNPMQNWNIHHNMFYGLSGTYPGEVVRSQWSGLHNVKLYNNTVEFAGTRTMNVVGVYGGTSENVDVRNNLVINTNTGYSYYHNQLIHRENGAVLNNLQVNNNILNNLDLNVGGLLGGVLGILNPILNNSTSDPQISKAGDRPEPYYVPLTGSPLIDAGTDVGFTYQGAAPDIGAYEFGNAANQLPSVSLTGPANNATFTAGAPITLEASATDSDGSVTRVEFFNGAAKLGEDATSPYSFSWSDVPEGTYSLTAVGTDDDGGTATSTAVVVTVGTSNSLPTVSFKSPTSDSSFDAGESINLAANASDSDGTISKVEFFNGTTRLAEDRIYPYRYIWNNQPTGTYSITAKATDNAGGTKTSAAISITVVPNSLPVVTLTSPNSNASFVAGSPIDLSATASDSDGTINKVEFFRGTIKLGQDTSSPFTFVWSNAAVGSYSITARAWDNKGAITASTPVNISITPSSVNSAPSISISSPGNNSSYLPGTSIVVGAIAGDTDGSVAKVEFFNDGSKVGEDASSPYSLSVGALASGAHTLTARAIDNLGATTISAPVAIAVNAETFTQVTLNASQASLSGTMALGSDGQGAYFSVPAGNGTNYFLPPPSGAVFNFHVAETDSYTMWVKVKSPTGNQGYHVYDGNGHWTTWLAGGQTQWNWVKVTDGYTGAPVSFAFSQGTNNIQFGWMDDNVQVNQVVLTNDPGFLPN